jgi:hypothetical protein
VVGNFFRAFSGAGKNQRSSASTLVSVDGCSIRRNADNIGINPFHFATCAAEELLDPLDATEKERQRMPAVNAVNAVNEFASENERNTVEKRTEPQREPWHRR